MSAAITDLQIQGGPLGDESRVFAFEADFARDLRCIPMVVRFKLDRCEIKLSLKQWSRLGRESRASLLFERCDTYSEIDAYRQRLVRLVDECRSGPIVLLDADPAPVWADERQVPLLVVQRAVRDGIAPPTYGQWADLATIERFALVKLARSNHDNDNFVPAMIEFALTL